MGTAVVCSVMRQRDPWGQSRDPKVLYMSFDKFLLAVESRDLSQADKRIIRVSSYPKLFLNDEIYSYTKKTIWHLAIWHN